MTERNPSKRLKRYRKYKANDDSFYVGATPPRQESASQIKKQDPISYPIILPTKWEQTIPTLPCRLHSNKIDPLSGYRIILMPEQPLLKNTPPEVVAYFGDRPYVEGSMQMAAFGRKQYYLILYLTLYVNNADKLLGQLDKGSFCQIFLANNKTVKLPAMLTALPKTGKSQTDFTIQLLVDAANLKMLAASEALTIRTYWSNGYADYPILYVNALREQILCLNQLGY